MRSCRLKPGSKREATTICRLYARLSFVGEITNMEPSRFKGAKLCLVIGAMLIGNPFLREESPYQGRRRDCALHGYRLCGVMGAPEPHARLDAAKRCFCSMFSTGDYCFGDFVALAGLFCVVGSSSNNLSASQHCEASSQNRVPHRHGPMREAKRACHRSEGRSAPFRRKPR